MSRAYINKQLNQNRKCEDWRGKAIDYETLIQAEQARNEELENDVQQLNDENARLNDEIKRLMEELGKLQSQVSELREQTTIIEQLRSDLHNVQHQLDLKLQQIDDLNHDVQTRDAELFKLQGGSSVTIITENKLLQMQSEIDRLQSLLKQREAELDGWRLKYSSLEKVNIQLRTENASIDSLQGTIKTLQQELASKQERINLRDDKIKQQDDIIDQLQNELNHLQGLKLEVENLKQQVHFKVQELTTCKEKLAAALREVGALRLYKGEVQVLESEKQLLRDEVDHLRGEIQKRLLEVEELSFIKASQEAQLKQIPFLEDEISTLRNLLADAISEKGILQTQFGQLQNENLALDNKYHTQEGELDELKLDNQRLLQINDHLNEQLQKVRNERNQFERDADQLDKTLHDVQQLLADAEEKNAQLEKEIKELKDELNKLRQQNLQQELDLQAKDRQHEQQRVQYEGYLNEQSLEIQRKEQLIKNWKDKYLQSEQLVSDLQFTAELLKQEQIRARQLELEIERLKQRQLHQPPPQIEHIVDQDEINQLRKQIQELQRENFDQYQQIQKLKQQIEQLNNHINILENEKHLFIQEIDRLKTQLNMKVEENEQMRAKMNDLNQTIFNLKHLESRVPELEQTINLLRQHSQDLIQQLNVKTKEYEDLYGRYFDKSLEANQVNQLQLSNNKLDIVRQEEVQNRENVKTDLNKVGVDNDRLRREKEYYESKYKYLLLEVEYLQRLKAESLQQDPMLELRGGNQDDVNEDIANLERQQQVLQDQLAKLQSQNEQKDKEIDDLNAQLRQLQAELNKLRNIQDLYNKLQQQYSLLQTQITNLQQSSSNSSAEKDNYINELRISYQ
ncbi:unnamed protein product (macronuclear) [Paramecium tetraurelia]|uniref:Uncharacterized protein n=1 Tax=Paramecium tetraurelia TaxID=5888 RepID=A0DPC4_PARTE|nr:uncharacterized protein GSPATT00019073001 [Paramecium tetraurelia]CAK84891.1 unnamed protein product [Paramecium tetraurelia]|eukprot:XP_001452288.1 hypothetical protein (macronuclear) [Paramecium tetraurelia strain d4-2]